MPPRNGVRPRDAVGDDDNVDLSPLAEYLKSERGHEIASRIIGLIEDVKKATVEKAAAHAIFEKWLQTGVLVVVVLASSVLSVLGKFDTSIGVLFGTLVGYFFGRHPAK